MGEDHDRLQGMKDLVMYTDDLKNKRGRLGMGFFLTELKIDTLDSLGILRIVFQDKRLDIIGGTKALKRLRKRKQQCAVLQSSSVTGADGMENHIQIGVRMQENFAGISYTKRSGGDLDTGHQGILGNENAWLGKVLKKLLPDGKCQNLEEIQGGA